jgi:hypothetical protein
MFEINLVFSISSLFLVHFSLDGRDGPALPAVDEEVGSPLVDDACTPVDIDKTLSVMRSIKTSSTTLSTTLNSCNGYEAFINFVLSVMARSQRLDGELSIHKCLYTYLEHWSNGYNFLNDYIASPW